MKNCVCGPIFRNFSFAHTIEGFFLGFHAIFLLYGQDFGTFTKNHDTKTKNHTIQKSYILLEKSDNKLRPIKKAHEKFTLDEFSKEIVRFRAILICTQ